jgi:hypothetical protein
LWCAEDPGFLVGSSRDELGVQQSEEVAAIDDLRKLITAEERKFKTWRVCAALMGSDE